MRLLSYIQGIARTVQGWHVARGARRTSVALFCKGPCSDLGGLAAVVGSDGFARTKCLSAWSFQLLKFRGCREQPLISGIEYFSHCEIAWSEGSPIPGDAPAVRVIT